MRDACRCCKPVITAHVWMTRANRAAVLRAGTQIFAVLQKYSLKKFELDIDQSQTEVHGVHSYMAHITEQTHVQCGRQCWEGYF